MFKIYCDGSCKGNGKKDSVGAWAYVILDSNNEIIASYSYPEPNTTNNQMEMKALIESVKRLEEFCKEKNLNFKVEVYTDSAYIHNCKQQKWYKNWIKNNWVNTKKEPVKNKELWEKIIPFFEDERIHIFKVKGHSKDENEHEKWNNYVDKMAQNAADILKRGF